MSTLLIRERLRRLGIAAARSQELADDDRQARDDAIEDGDLNGLTVREIAEEVGLSQARVHKIILERTAARQDRQMRAAGLA